MVKSRFRSRTRKKSMVAAKFSREMAYSYNTGRIQIQILTKIPCLFLQYRNIYLALFIELEIALSRM